QQFLPTRRSSDLVNTIQLWGCLSGLLLLNVIFGIVKAGRKLSPRWGTLTRVGLFSLRKNLLPRRRRLLVLVAKKVSLSMCLGRRTFASSLPLLLRNRFLRITFWRVRMMIPKLICRRRWWCQLILRMIVLFRMWLLQGIGFMVYRFLSCLLIVLL